MSFPTSYTITLVAYRPSLAVESLGHLDAYIESSFLFFVFSGAQELDCRAKMRDIIACDLRRRREDSRVPLHALVLLVNGRLPFSQDKVHADWLIRSAIQDASDVVEAEFRQLELERLQLERARSEMDRRVDFQTLRELHSKYTMAELRTAGVFDQEEGRGADGAHRVRLDLPDEDD